MDIKKKVKSFPSACGVYIMRSKKGEVLYIGKASSLNKRVSSYFISRGSPKTDSLLVNMADIDYIECETPEQALILEAALIKEKKPKYNITLKDSKSYPYVEVTKEKFSRIFISRPKKRSGKILFGPYPRTKTVKSALMLMRNIFPYRSCGVMPKTACLFFHLKLCPAPCVGEVSVSDYKINVDSIRGILKGERKRIIKSLETKMAEFAAKEDFEGAAKIRDKLISVNDLYKGKPQKHEIISLKEIIKLPCLPLVIEAIDISSLDKNTSAGSVVVFRNGLPEKNSYRRFMIKKVESKDDYAMIGEVVNRRYTRLRKEGGKLPDLIVIDGGKGHVQRAKQELDDLGLKIPVIGIAKQNEEIWLPFKRKPLVIPRSNPGLRLIQRARDEAHRFAHKYHLVRRKKVLLQE